MIFAQNYSHLQFFMLILQSITVTLQFGGGALKSVGKMLVRDSYSFLHSFAPPRARKFFLFYILFSNLLMKNNCKTVKRLKSIEIDEAISFFSNCKVTVMDCNENCKRKIV